MRRSKLALGISSLILGNLANASTVELAISYDEYAEAASIDTYGVPIKTRIKNMVSGANVYYARQNIPITLKANVITKQLNGVNAYPTVTGDRITSDHLYALATHRNSMKLRSAYNADYRVHFTTANTSVAGRAYLKKGEGIDPYTYSANSIIDINNNLYLPHELGHNFGLLHSQRQDPNSSGVYTYGKGYGVDNYFATIMAYPSAFSAGWIPYFSDPNNSLPGYGTIGAADANSTLALKKISGYLSDYDAKCQSDYKSQTIECVNLNYVAAVSWVQDGKMNTNYIKVKDSNEYYTYTDPSPVNTQRTNVSIQLWTANFQYYAVEKLRSCSVANTTPGKAYKFEIDLNSTHCKAIQL